MATDQRVHVFYVYNRALLFPFQNPVWSLFLSSHFNFFFYTHPAPGWHTAGAGLFVLIIVGANESSSRDAG